MKQMRFEMTLRQQLEKMLLESNRPMTSEELVNLLTDQSAMEVEALLDDMYSNGEIEETENGYTADFLPFQL
jgi:chromosome segregation and condensation protein ScpB